MIVNKKVEEENNGKKKLSERRRMVGDGLPNTAFILTATEDELTRYTALANALLMFHFPTDTYRISAAALKVMRPEMLDNMSQNGVDVTATSVSQPKKPLMTLDHAAKTCGCKSI